MSSYQMFKNIDEFVLWNIIPSSGVRSADTLNSSNGISRG